ncbi:hypothetical protein [Rothia dentocariosa]|nr:hypothetical protein [Rothia dentocariosa]
MRTRFWCPRILMKILDARARLCLRAELLETVRYRLANPQPGVKVSLDEL